MHILVKSITEIMTSPLAFVRTQQMAERILGAPVRCETAQWKASFESYDEAREFCDDIAAKLHALRMSDPSWDYITAGVRTREPIIVPTFEDGYKIRIEVFIPLEQLPVGRNGKEALEHPLGYGPILRRTFEFEGQKTRLASVILKPKYKRISTAQKRFQSRISQKSVKLVKQGDVWRPKFRYWKAPNVMFDKDRALISARQNQPYYGRPKNMPPRELGDLFNRHIRLVEEEGSGIKMGGGSRN